MNIKRSVLNINFYNLTFAVIVGLIVALITTGFIYGFLACSDCGWGLGGILGRLWIGIVHIFLTLITFGKPWSNEGATSSVNLQAYVFLVFILATYFIYRQMQESKV